MTTAAGASAGATHAGDDAFVLMVDDQPAKLLTYGAILHGLDATLTAASSAREALDHLLKRDYAVILIDVCMPELDGYELASMIRDHPRFRQTAIIFVSGVHLTDLDRLRGYECGAVDYVPVPVVPEILRAKVGIFVELYRKTRQLERLNQDLERRVAARTAELEDANRRKDEFLAVLAHELRNPLAAIRTASELLTHPLSAEHVGQTTTVVRRQVNQLVRLIDDLVDVSRITRGAISLQCHPLEIAAVVQQAVETNRPLLDTRRHVLTLHIPDESLMVNGDEARLSQIISNVLHNAAKFTDPGGRVLLRVERQGAHVVIRVRDNGIGIAPDGLPRVFELFTQVSRPLDRTSGGLGIGLALVRRLIDMHGGDIRVHSDGVGQGTEVVVTLPLLEAPQAVPAVSPADIERLGTSLPPCRIVIADDNGDAANSLSLLLTMCGHDVRTAPDGQELLRVAAEFGPRIVLLDIGMPKLNGYETARQIRTQPWGHGVALVAVTGWGQPTDRQRAIDAGFDAHLVKPVSHRDLFETLAALIESPRPLKLITRISSRH